MTLGDNDYTLGKAFATNWTSSFGWLSAAGVGVAGTVGNHDFAVDRGRYEFDLLGMPASYYVRRVNDVQLIVLDSNAITNAQTRWLKRVLAKRTPLRRIVAFHHPPYTCGGHLGSRHRPASRSLFERYGVRLVLSGHDHNYQRFKRRGVTYVVHGGGGAGLYALRRCPAGDPRPGWQGAGDVRAPHLTVTSARVDVQVVDLEGKAVDAFRVT